MRSRNLKNGAAFYWEPPHWARPPHERAGRPCPVQAAALGSDLASAVMKANQYNAALDDWRSEEILPSGPIAGTVAWVFNWYRQQEVFTKKREKTRKDYSKIMDAVCAVQMKQGTFGDRRASAVNTTAADQLYAQFIARGPRQAMYVVQVCRLVWNWAGRYPDQTGVSRSSGNPFAGMRKSYTPTDGNRPTTRSEYVRYCEMARELGYDSMAAAAALSFELVQRVSDAFGYNTDGADEQGAKVARGISWSDYQPGKSIKVFQNKTSRRLVIPLVARMPDGEKIQLYPELEDALARIMPSAPSGLMIKDELSGLPYKERRVSTVHRRICKAAKLPKAMTPTGFRHGGATEFGDAGITDFRPISGHTELKTAAIYNKANVAKARRIAVVRREHIRRIDIGDEGDDEELSE